ncbi:hypothetical protein JKA74_14295 [Marivirga sp. S37H4]|uniref:Uncharacterized protein n=1 Tax=Marivirga aurantiaca TaxID=2802615 RepID=A0A934X0H1_9BACT|nr:hypothetical protein [Marivirga aurantiaca]MBK6266212.1 hypothetical protein [Marivirga aurantiaca]
MTGTINLNEAPKKEMFVRIVVADRETNNIIFHSAEQTRQIDPRIPEQIETMVKKMIRPLYYKNVY